MNTLATTNLDSINDLSASQAAFAGGILGSALIFGLIFFVLIVIAQWKIFEKAGEKGWKSIIPIYGQYILFKIIGAKKWFWILFGVSLVTSIMMTANPLPIDYNASEAEISAQLELIDWSKYIPFAIGMVVSCIVTFIAEILVAVKLAKAFGKGAAYMIGLVLVAPIVFMVLGFGQAKYDKKVLKNN